MLVDIFPSARFVCLYRHPMDVIASGLAASRRGFSAYGFEPASASITAIARPPLPAALHQDITDNVVRGLAMYWYDQMAAVRRFEQKHQDRCASDHKLPYMNGIEPAGMGRGATARRQ